MEDLANDPDYGKPRHSDTGWRARMRAKPGGAKTLKIIVFLVGLFFVALGCALIVLPGPLTIPPILLGVFIWSTEFAWADKLLDRAKAAFDEAWEQAKKRPVISSIVTGAGLIGAGVVIWAFLHYGWLDKAKDAVGIG
jgi:hypothetical protein